MGPQIRYSIKKFFPFILAISLFCFVTITSICLSSPIFDKFSIYQDYNGKAIVSLRSETATNLDAFTVCGMFIALIAPLGIYDYKYSLKTVDTYYQAEIGSKKIRNIRLIVVYLMIIAAFSIVYITCIGILALRQGITPLPEADSSSYYSYHNLNFGYYFLSYLLTLVFMSAQYAISSFFLSKGNRFSYSFLTLIFGEIALGLGMVVFISFIQESFGLDFGYRDTGLFNSSFVYPCVLIHHLFEDLILYNKLTVENFPSLFHENPANLIFFIINAVLFVGFAVFAGIRVFKDDDPSGEYAGGAKCVDATKDIALNSVFAILGCALSLTFNDFQYNNDVFLPLFSSLGILYWAGIYYLITAVFYRTFKTPKYQLFTMLGVAVMFILSCSLIAASPR